MDNKIPDAQLRAWMLTATIPTILSVVGRNGWLSVLVTGLVCATITSAVLSGKKKSFPRWLCVAEIIWLVLYLGGVARISAVCWQAVGNPLGISCILLLLAAMSSYRGARYGARAGATLAWLVLPVLGIVALTGAMNMRVNWVRMTLEIPDGVLVSLLLFPCVGIFLPSQSRKVRWVGIVLCVIAVTGSLLADGTMGPDVSYAAGNTFGELSKGITLFGVAERFEALVTCALTASWFVLFTLILSVIKSLCEKVFQPMGKWLVFVGAIIAAGLMCILPNGGWWMIAGTLIFWGFLPALTQVIGYEKNIEKK